ncbi:MAG: glucose dehydrogenase [Chloroflexi bacterium]|nr:MAG: glucose dehydrogenase [Chloroflexota bacterium]
MIRARLITVLFIFALVFTACAVPDNESEQGTATSFVEETAVDEPNVTDLSPVEIVQESTPEEPTPAESAATETPTAAPTPEPTRVVNVTALPNPAGYTFSTVVDGLNRPVGFEVAGDGSGRFFILEQAGRIRVVQDGGLLPDPFLDIVDRVGSSGSEQGLLGLAFHPSYPETGSFFVNYTDKNGDTHISRFQVTSDANLADPNSETELLFVDQPFPNHNGGGLVFGPDNYLYASLGDGGSGGDPAGNAQSLNTHLGKILRIDVDGGDPYGIPPDNPFVNGEGMPEIWYYGLRNSWRFSFDRATNDVYIADVGQNRWEEINFVPSGSGGGLNFGWDYFEGTHQFEGTPPSGVDLIQPVAEYDHSQGCSVTGGFVYRGQALPEWQGVYIYGDYCTGFVWGMLPSGGGSFQSELLFQTGANISAFGEDEQGELYLVEHTGEVLRLVQE